MKLGTDSNSEFVEDSREFFDLTLGAFFKEGLEILGALGYAGFE